jgi:hypothetical protein
MKCDDFLPALETGGPLRRRRARRHAARCPRCAAVAAQLAAVKRPWADVPPLAAGERLLWERAAMDDAGAGNIPLPAQPRRLVIPNGRQWWAAAACVLLAVSIAVTLVVRHKAVQVADRPPHVPSPTTTRAEPSRLGPVRVELVDAARELDQLAAAVGRLDVQMQELRRQAERAEARSQVASALDQFGHW